jgi:hypothetical protein
MRESIIIVALFLPFGGPSIWWSSLVESNQLAFNPAAQRRHSNFKNLSEAHTLGNTEIICRPYYLKRQNESNTHNITQSAVMAEWHSYEKTFCIYRKGNALLNSGHVLSLACSIYLLFPLSFLIAMVILRSNSAELETVTSLLGASQQVRSQVQTLEITNLKV